MIYLDSSALVKLLIEEDESSALDDWLSARLTTPKASSDLAKVEVMRTCRRLDADALPEARGLLAGLHLIPLRADVVSVASELADPALRSLDALHLASVLSIRPDLSAFVVYDHRLIEAASTAGLETLSPGAATL